MLFGMLITRLTMRTCNAAADDDVPDATVYKMLDVCSEATVDKLLFSPTPSSQPSAPSTSASPTSLAPNPTDSMAADPHGRCTGVTFINASGEVEFAYLAKGGEVILTSGAINSPQILLRSGIGCPQELVKHGIPLRRDLPGVGKNLQDHLQIRANFRTKAGIKTLNDRVNSTIGLLKMVRVLAQDAHRFNTDQHGCCRVEILSYRYTGMLVPARTVHMLARAPHVSSFFFF